MLIENYSDQCQLGEEYFNMFSPLLFVIGLLPLIHILRETGMGYQLEKNRVKVNHRLFFIDDLKLYGKTDKQID